jgi:hypothetical protein
MGGFELSSFGSILTGFPTFAVVVVENGVRCRLLELELGPQVCFSDGPVEFLGL